MNLAHCLSNSDYVFVLYIFISIEWTISLLSFFFISIVIPWFLKYCTTSLILGFFEALIFSIIWRHTFLRVRFLLILFTFVWLHVLIAYITSIGYRLPVLTSLLKNNVWFRCNYLSSSLHISISEWLKIIKFADSLHIIVFIISSSLNSIFLWLITEPALHFTILISRSPDDWNTKSIDPLKTIIIA